MTGLIIDYRSSSFSAASGTLSLGDMTGGIVLPSGGTANRPGLNAGLIRYNTDATDVEYANGSVWTSLGTGVLTSVVTGTGLTGGTITTSGTIGVQTNGITNLMLAQRPALSLMGNPTVGIASVSNITLGTGLSFSSGTSLAKDTTGIVAGTYSNPTLVVDAFGRITTISSNRVRSNSILYVSPSGNDSNSGTTIGSPFLTIQKAVDVATLQRDLMGSGIIIQLADGTYTNQVTATVPTMAAPINSNTSPITITGNAGTPANVHLSMATTSAIVVLGLGAHLRVQNLKITTAGTQSAHLLARNGGIISFKNIIFGAAHASSWHIIAEAAGQVAAVGPYTIEGGAFSHILTRYNSLVYVQTVVAVTLTGTPAFTSFIECAAGAVATIRGTFSGAATGVRYSGSLLGHFDLNGAGTNYFPGNAAGILTSGAQYT